jgi:hypothetical protein
LKLPKDCKTTKGVEKGAVFKVPEKPRRKPRAFFAKLLVFFAET